VRERSIDVPATPAFPASHVNVNVNVSINEGLLTALRKGFPSLQQLSRTPNWPNGAPPSHSPKHWQYPLGPPLLRSPQSAKCLPQLAIRTPSSLIKNPESAFVSNRPSYQYAKAQG
jgi:hypothetical protein